MTGRHLVLVGLMGAGKTSVGAGCADRLGRPFVDTDDLVELATGRTVGALFAEMGEDAFRNLERRAVSDACASPAPAVIACGGGAVLAPENRRLLRESGTVVWLRAPAAVLAERVGDGDGRPLLSGAPVGATLARLEASREGAYREAADAVVETEGLDVDAVVEAVLGIYGAGTP